MQGWLYVVAFFLRFTGEGHVFFLQKRIGRDKSVFGVIKFATMLKDSPNIGSGTVTLEADPRILPVGRVLRKTKINELPQLFNIFIGHMSVIGPRPLHHKQLSFYSESDRKIIVSVKPGLSGVGSIIFRDEEKILQNSNDPDATYKKEITPKKAELEKWYVKNKSIGLYFKLIFLTVIAVASSNIDMKKFFKGL